MGSIFPPPHHSFSMPLSLSLSLSVALPSIPVASFLRPSLPYTSPIIALEQCQPAVGPQTARLSSPSVPLLSPWPHLLNTLLVSGSVESHCGLTKEMWDWFLPLQIKLKFSSCARGRARLRARARVCQRRARKNRYFSNWQKSVLFLCVCVQPGWNIMYTCAHPCCVCLCITTL